MEEGILWLIIIAAVIVLSIPFYRYIIPGILWVVSMLALFLFAALDQLFNAAFIPHAPWVMWVIGGALIGGALGFCTVAPVYGLKKARPLIALSPIMLLGVLMLIRLAIS